MQINGLASPFISLSSTIVNNKGNLNAPIIIDAKAIIEPAHTYSQLKNKYVEPIVNQPSQTENKDNQQAHFIRFFASQSTIGEVSNNPVTLAPDLPKGVLDYIQNSQLKASEQGRLFDEMV